MNFDPTEDQTLFRAAVERFVGSGDVQTREAARRGPGGVDPARWSELARLGLLMLPRSDARGGLGGDRADCAVVAEALGRGLAPEPWLECAYWPLRLLEGLELGGALGDRIASAELRVAVAFAEPAGGFAILPRHVHARRCSDGWSLSGEKRFVLAGGGADLFLVTARTEGGPALFAVNAGNVEARAYALVDGGRAVAMTMHELVVPDAACLGLVEAALADAVAETRIMAAAEMVGLADRLLDETLAYVNQREQFGQKIGRFQAVQHRLVDCYTMLDQMRSALCRMLLDAPDATGGWRQRSAGGKGFVAERALHIGHEAIQLHGGMGMSDELVIGHAHKRVLLLSKLFGDAASDLATFASAA